MRATDVLEELRRLPMRPSAVWQALVVLDDPAASADEIATALQSDPALCARILHLANSPYFGLSGKVSSVERAVVALGTSVVRSLAVSTAAGMFSDRPGEVPAGFWRHSVSVAAGSSIAARMCSVPAGDAMCAGLLHDLGAALVFRLDRPGYERLLRNDRPHTLCAEEAQVYGGDHAMVGAFALDAWKLPRSIVGALRGHHLNPLDAGEKLARVVIAGEALARAALAGEELFPHEPASDAGEAFAALGLRGVSLDNLVRRTAEETELLDDLLSFR